MKIEAFQGYRYPTGASRDVSAIVAPPYDQISPEMREALYAMHPHNLVRVTFPREEPDHYHGARAVLDRWLAEGVWQREAEPAIYPYHQTYTVAGDPASRGSASGATTGFDPASRHERDTAITRMGFVALGEVTDYAAGVVLPHERTHAGPKKDRLELMEATRADTGLIFMLVGDPAGDLLRATTPEGAPIAEARDGKGERHTLWRITDPALVARVVSLMAPRQVIIADGHHRYETAVEYARRHPGSDHKLMAFFTLEAPGLTILPNHRLVHDLRDFSLAALLERARPWFDVAPLADPSAFRATSRSIGVVTAREAAVLALRDDAVARIDWPGATSAAWRRLAVSILHEGVLRPLLGITDAMLDAKTHVDYTADQAEAIALARAGRCQAAFLIAPTTPEELQAVVRDGEVLPQKSTHFYPKLLDGLVFHHVGTSSAGHVGP